MLKVNDTIIILSSEELPGLNLEGLTGKTGLVIEDLNEHGRKNKGYIIKLDEAYLDEYIWFIPTNSCSHV